MAGQVVQITINVTDGNAAEAVQQVVAQFEALGAASNAAGAQAGAGLDKIAEHGLSAQENVRLLNDDLGLRIPRAMQAAIMQSETLKGAISAVGGGLIALGAVDVFAHMAEGAYDLYEKYLDVNSAADEYYKKLAESQDKDFTNAHSIETAAERWRQAADAAQQYHQAAQNAQHAGSSIGWGDVGMALLGPMAGLNQAWDTLEQLRKPKLDEDTAYKNQEQADALRTRQLELQHEFNTAQLDAAHGGDAVLKGLAKIGAELSDHLATIKETAAYQERLDNVLNTTPGKVQGWTPDIARSSHAGPSQMELTQDATARAKARADEIELQRQMTDQIIQMQNEATNAALEGDALRDAQESQGIETIVRKFMQGEITKQQGMEETAALEDKFAAQALKLQEELDTQTKHLSDEANQAGLKGMQLLSAQLQTQLDAIDAAERKAVGPGGIETGAQSSDFNSQRDSARRSSNRKSLEEETQFQAQMRQLMDQSNDYEQQGYARIDAEEGKRLDEAFQRDVTHYGDVGKAIAAWAQQAVQIEADADREREQLHHRTMEQLTKEEQETARMLLPEWQQAQLAIEDQYHDRLRQVTQDVATHVMTEQEGAAAVVAAWQLASAQMQKSEEEARDKIATGLQSLFTHPEKFFEDTAMKAGFQLMANEMLSVFQSSGPAGGILQFLFGMGPQMNTSTNPLNAMSSALQLGGHHSGIGGMTNPSMMQFQQGSTTILSSSQMFMQAVAAFQSAVGSNSLSGASGLAGMGGGGFGMLGSTGGGAGASASGMPAFSTGNGMVGSSPMPEVQGNPMAGTLNPDGSFTSASSTPGTLGTVGGIVGGGLMGATSIFSAYQNSNPIAGAAGGAMGGMEMGGSIGSLVGGPAGAAIGGAIGAIAGGIGGLLAGVFGDRGKGQAEGLDVNTVQPQISKDMQEYQSGQAGYSAIASDLANLLTSSNNSTSKWGSGARNYFSSNIQPEINAAMSSLQKQEAGGRSAVTFSAAQFHDGGWTGDFGDMATSGNEGFIHAMANEFVVQPRAAMAHAPLLSAINAGNVSYSSSVQPRMPASGGGATVNLSVQALDSKSVAQWAKSGGGRTLVSAINQAQTQYSGTGR